MVSDGDKNFFERKIDINHGECEAKANEKRLKVEFITFVERMRGKFSYT